MLRIKYNQSMEKILSNFIKTSLQEDIRKGDITSIACIDKEKRGKAKLIAKESCIIAGLKIAKSIYHTVDSNLVFKPCVKDGNEIKKNDIIFSISGNQQAILASERLVLNCMQRMSGISTKTRQFVNKVKDLNVTILDTRKTCPSIRFIDKQAVKIGGAENHRNGLYDAIMIKDNHSDFSGGVRQAISRCKNYLESNKIKNIPIIVESRNLQELKEIIQIGGVDRILLDNFSIEKTKKAVKIVNQKIPLESSGNISLKNVREYALCGVNCISIGSLTHSVKSIDLSMRCI